MQVLDFLIILFLMIVLFQDLKYRAISWIFFPIGFLLFVFKSFTYGSFSNQSILIGVNFGVCLLIFLFLTIYFSIKEKKVINIVDKYIGKGDLFFVLIVSVGFSTINFILFINISLFLILLFYGVFVIFSKTRNDKIPFAGLLSLFYGLFLILNGLYFKVNPYIDINLIFKQ
jgi:hypothetical protein